GTPVFFHPSPLADVAWGSPSIVADKMALKLVGPQGFVVTETPDCENFFSVTCRSSGLRPHVLVLVTSVPDLKTYGSGPPVRKKKCWGNLELLEEGCALLKRRLETARAYGVPVLVAVNTFGCDTETEVELVCRQARRFGALEAVRCTSWPEGGAGALELAHGVQRAAEIQGTLHFTCELQ
ncbi:C-1-tetrahydrofolate synthase, cytoplasmic, partial [Tachysurus ichikawai]